ncbi:Osmosensitive K+ channel histidine kinase KdpD [Paramagnetospirillum magnetotacticum MS-1]|uniref:histidine kinase n=1 Tax=Paramagnetospirillum magnetotacticum MS-1 TaxID=272627 RepID=A0A0C2YVC2_PARME|nr:HAMP domain-containing sensor histidine kinase [Paramagnetospirillum magnetotacticum]KIL98630.1 Osmosensitive K+ channel histidine kinase KdpD [Paramagnetospirillum magnetotacticum MS-1]
MDATDDQVIRDRLMIQIHLITSAYSIVYIITSLGVGYPIGVMMMSVCFIIILALLAYFRRSGRYRLTGNLFLADCLFIAILSNSIFTGGSSSPVIHWIFIIPVCSVILLGLSKDTLAWLTISIAGLVAMPIASTLGYDFDTLYDLNYKELFESICDLGLVTILFFAAAVFHANRSTLIDKLKQTEQALQETNRQIQNALDTQRKAIQEQRNFMGMVSHEFRTPLGIISGAASVLRLAPQGGDDARTETDKVFRAVRRMDHMIDMLTDDDWLYMVATEFRHRPVNIKSLMEAAMAEVSDLAPARPIHLSLDEPLQVYGDKDLLSVAFSNLVGNASKYSPPTTPIEVWMSRQDNRAEIRVVDHGAGIEPADLPRVFEKYYRSSTVKHAPGTGLGLYLVKSIIERHGGSISVNSSPGQGATFTLSLPLYD